MERKHMEKTLTTYFDPNISIKASGASLNGILTTVAERYIGQNPANSFRFRSYREDSFLPNAEGIYKFDLNRKLPEAKMTQNSLIAAKFYQFDKGNRSVLVRCYSKVAIYFNGSLFWKSTTNEENNGKRLPVWISHVIRAGTAS